MTDLPDWYTHDTPKQLTRAHLQRMTPEQIARAYKEGNFKDLLTPKPNPWAGREDELLAASKNGTLNSLIAAERQQASDIENTNESDQENTNDDE